MDAATRSCSGAGLVDPQVHVAAALRLRSPRRPRASRSAADRVAGHAVVRVDDELEGPAAVASRHLGVADRVIVAVVAGHQAGEALPAALRPGRARRARRARRGRRRPSAASSSSVTAATSLGPELALLTRSGARRAGTGYPVPTQSASWDVRGHRRAGPRETSRRLADEYPGTAAELCALDFATPFQLLVATVLSAQTTDERVNMVTPAVFARYPTPADPRRRRAGGAGGADPLHRVLPLQDQEPDRAGPGPRRALRR